MIRLKWQPSASIKNRQPYAGGGRPHPPLKRRMEFSYKVFPCSGKRTPGGRERAYSCTLLLMRRALAIGTWLALELAFLFAPFQHVHPGSDHPAVTHTHFYRFHFASSPPAESQGNRVQADDDDHANAWALDTFKLKQSSIPGLFLPLRSLLVVFAPQRTFDSVEVVEERGHDPPGRDSSTPRAPPV
jgi:hypothetical protein